MHISASARNLTHNLKKGKSDMNAKTKEQKTDVSIEKPFKRPKKRLMEGGGPLHCIPVEGHHLRWVAINSDKDPTSMSWALGQNYSPVSPEEQDLIAYERSGDPHNTGSDIRRTGRDGITLVLMKQSNEDYEESIREITKYNDEQVAAKTTPVSKDVPTFGGSVNISEHNLR